MRRGNVRQLQALNEIMAMQLHDHLARTILILGVAGGNGLEHIDSTQVKRVCGVDINEEYLAVCRKRHARFGDKLQLLCLDICAEECTLPKAELVIANLIVEHVGLTAFCRQMGKIRREGMALSCVIQANRESSYVSHSPYSKKLQTLDAVHHDIPEADLISCLEEEGYNMLMREEYPLPDGKKLIRIDFMG